MCTYVKPIVRVKCIYADVGITKSDVETVIELDEEKGTKKPIDLMWRRKKIEGLDEIENIIK